MSRKRSSSAVVREQRRRQDRAAGEAPPAQPFVAASRRAAATTCGWCGGPITLQPTGRIPTWCSHACRQRAWEQKRAAESGRCAVTVVERVVAAPAPAGSRQRRDWPALLTELANDLDRGLLYRRDLPALTAALGHVLVAYRRAAR